MSTTITGRQIRDETLTGADIQDGTLELADLSPEAQAALVAAVLAQLPAMAYADLTGTPKLGIDPI